MTFLLLCVSAWTAAAQSSDAEPNLAALVANLDRANAVLEQDPENVNALLTRAITYLQLRKFDEALLAARTAYDAAITGTQKYQAASLAATAHFKSTRYVRAEWWLRRASNHTRNPEEAARIRQEFATVRQQNPWRMNLSFSVAPSDNINGGAEEEFFSLGDIRLRFSPDALALSGVEYSGEADLSYRLSKGPKHLTTVGLSVYGRTFSLSSEAQENVPDASGSDYSLVQIGASIGHRHQLIDRLGPSGVTIYTGKIWYGGEPLRRYNRLALSQEFPLNKNTGFAMFGFVEKQYGLREAEPDAIVQYIQGTGYHRFSNNDIVQLTLNKRFHNADLETFTFTDTGASLSYKRARPILNTRLEMTVGVGRKSFEEFSLSLDGRRDTYNSISAKATFESFEYFGFAPNLTVSAIKTRSNVARYTTSELEVRFGIASTF